MGILSKTHYGEPTSSKVEKNPSITSRTTPQAWSREFKGKVLWFYNYPGAMAEAKSRGERLPTIDELLTVTNSLPGNCEEKVEALSLSFDGCRIRISNSGEFSNDGIISYLWASSPNGDDNARYIYLHRDDDHAIAFWGDRGHGLPVRPFR